jgi:hypothetical protein
MTRLLLSIVTFGFLFVNVLCSIKNLNEEFKSKLRKSIIQEFDLFVTETIEINFLLHPLHNVANDIDILFLSDTNIDESIVDKLVSYMTSKLYETGALNSITAHNLLRYLKEICIFHKNEYESKKRVLLNTQALKTMADVCHKFKASVQWLVLESKVLGHPNLFGDAPTLLENIRRAFLETFDPKLDSVDLKAKLKFIKDSFDFYFLQQQPDRLSGSFSIFMELKTEFMKQIDAIIKNLVGISNPFVALSTGLGQNPIRFDLVPNLTSSNEDLWNFIAHRIGIIREIIESNCSNLIALHGQSIVDLIITNILENSQNNVPFTLKKVHSAISESFLNYVSLIDSTRKDGIINVDILDQEAEHIETLFKSDLKTFNDELKSKINEIKGNYGLNSSEANKIDLSRIAVASMAFDYSKANLQKTF